MKTGPLVVLYLLVLTLTSLERCSAARILGVFGTYTPSHYAMYGAVMKELVQRGHHVTVASHFPQKNKIENLTDISLLGIVDNIYMSVEEILAMNFLEDLEDFVEFNKMSCELILKHPIANEILQSGEYDVFVTEIFASECFLPLGYKLGIPTIGMISSVSLPWVSDMVANPDNPSFIPLYFLPYTQNMKFFERLVNTAATLFVSFFYEVRSYRAAQELAERALGPLPPLKEIARNYSLILANSHHSVNQVRPVVPQLVEVGGLHIPKTIPPLPKDLEEYINESEHGFILFSLGSLVPTESIPVEKLQDIIEVLGSLKERVLWKVNDTAMPKLNMPSNVMLSNWVPQLSVLCHPSTKLFIGHGGLLGIQEAVNCGVPMLGVPMFADQSMNIAELRDKGMALELLYEDINKESFAKAINSLLTDSKFHKNAKHLSELFKERPQHPLDSAIYWIEYVIKFGGAKHLRSAAHNLSWYQYYLLDVTLFLTIATLLLILTIYHVLRLIFFIIVTSKSNYLKKNN